MNLTMSIKKIEEQSSDEIRVFWISPDMSEFKSFCLQLSQLNYSLLDALILPIDSDSQLVIQKMEKKPKGMRSEVENQRFSAISSKGKIVMQLNSNELEYWIESCLVHLLRPFDGNHIDIDGQCFKQGTNEEIGLQIAINFPE